MAHRTARTAYLELADRLNRFPQGAPASDLLFQILEMLFSPREAELVAQLPIRTFTVARAARVWNMSEAAAERVLDELAGRAILLDLPSEEGRSFVLAPPMAGFLEFSMMRVRDDLDQKLLAELYPKRKRARLDRSLCLGCGVCVPACPEHGLQMADRGDRVITPVDSTHRVVAMAVERGTLQHLFFDARELRSHRMMAALLGGILRLPPVKRFLAASQLGSRYLDALIEGTESGSPKTGREAS